MKVESRQVDNITQIVIQEVDEEDRPNSGSPKEFGGVKENQDKTIENDAVSSL